MSIFVYFNLLIILVNFILIVLISRKIGFVYCKSSRLFPLFVFLYFAIYMVLLPLYYLKYPLLSLSVGNQVDVLLIYFELSNTIFLVLLFLMLNIGELKFCIFSGRKSNISYISKPCLLLFLLITLLSVYVVNVMKFNSFFYISKLDIFEQLQGFKGGRYILVVFSSILIWPLLLILSSLIERFRSYFLILAFSLIIAMIFFLVAKHPSRFYTINFILTTFIYIEYLRKEKISLIRMSLLVLLLLISLIVLNKLRISGTFNVSYYDLFVFFRSIMTNFLQVENALKLIEYYFIHDYTYLIFFMYDISLYAFVPRIFFPFGKEDTGIEEFLTENVFANGLNPVFYSPNSTLTFTVPITGYAELGFWGVFLHSLLYTFLFVLFLNLSFRCNTGYERILYIYILNMILIGFRTSLHAVLVFLVPNLLFIFFMRFFLLLCLTFLRRFR